jgi:hypothetical protein
MTDLPQETDPRTTPHSSRSYPFPVGLSDVTSDINGGPESLSFAGESDPLRQPREIIPRVDNRCVAEQLERLLSIIGQMIQLVKQEREGREPNDMPPLPPLRACVDIDGSVLLEWIFPDFRVGFNIEPDPQDSGWHLVSNKKVGEITASGQLTNTSEIVAALLDFILPNI